MVIGGIDHIASGQDSLSSKLNARSVGKVLSIGQRDAMYPYLSSTQVQDLAKAYNVNDLVIHKPEFALANVKGVATILHPPDYRITVHDPQVQWRVS